MTNQIALKGKGVVQIRQIKGLARGIAIKYKPRHNA
jgi:hypothetical protein